MLALKNPKFLTIGSIHWWSRWAVFFSGVIWKPVVCKVVPGIDLAQCICHLQRHMELIKCLTFCSSWDYFLVWMHKCRIGKIIKASFKTQMNTWVLFRWFMGPPPLLMRIVAFHWVCVSDNSLQKVVCKSRALSPPAHFIYLFLIHTLTPWIWTGWLFFFFSRCFCFIYFDFSCEKCALVIFDFLKFTFSFWFQIAHLDEIVFQVYICMRSKKMTLPKS